MKDAENDMATKLHALREELDAKWDHIMKSVVFVLIELLCGCTHWRCYRLFTGTLHKIDKWTFYSSWMNFNEYIWILVNPLSWRTAWLVVKSQQPFTKRRWSCVQKGYEYLYKLNSTVLQSSPLNICDIVLYCYSHCYICSLCKLYTSYALLLKHYKTIQPCVVLWLPPSLK